MADCSLAPPSPFLALLGEPLLLWPCWILYKTYILAAGLETIYEGRKHALLLHCLGADRQHMFGTLSTSGTYTEAVKLMKRNVGFTLLDTAGSEIHTVASPW